MRRTALGLFLSLAIAQSASAADINFTRGVSQSAFESLTREAGAALSYKNTAPAAPLGLTGFDVALEVLGEKIHEDSEYWRAATGDRASSFLVVPKLRARKGLPFGIGVGAMFSAVPDSNIRLFGFEVSSAILDGSVALPAIGVRATYTKLINVDEFGLQTAGVDASISKGFVIVTPYAGAGLLWIEGTPKGRLVSDPVFIAVNGGPLEKEKLWQSRFFGGLKITPAPLFGITAEVEYSGRPTYSLKAALSF